MPHDNFLGEGFVPSCTKQRTNCRPRCYAEWPTGLSSATLHWGGHQQLPSFQPLYSTTPSHHLLCSPLPSPLLPHSPSATPPPLSLSLFPPLPPPPPSYSPLSPVASPLCSQFVLFLRPVDHSLRTAPRGYFGSSLPHHRWRTEYHSSAPSTPQAWSQVWLSQTVRESREPSSGNIVPYHLTVCINCPRDFIMRMTSMST